MTTYSIVYIISKLKTGVNTIKSSAKAKSARVPGFTPALASNHIFNPVRDR